jgi:hypothetical protein
MENQNDKNWALGPKRSRREEIIVRRSHHAKRKTGNGILLTYMAHDEKNLDRTQDLLMGQKAEMKNTSDLS